jgi:hypothetical protein
VYAVLGLAVVSANDVTVPPTVVNGDPFRVIEYPVTPTLSVLAPHARSTRVELAATAVTFDGADGAAPSPPPPPEKSYVCSSKVRPVESVGVTVTWLPLTLTSRKWNTFAGFACAGARHADPPEPIAYASKALQLLTRPSSAPPAPVT